MDHTGNFARSLDDSLIQIRDLPQLQSLRIAPLRQPVPSRILSVPSPLEPNASGGARDASLSKTNAASAGNLPATLPTLTEFLNAARSTTNDPSVDSLLSLEPPPKPILPAFVNLRAVERFPYSSFDDDTLHAPRKRLRIDIQAESFGEHLQLPIPQTQKEQRPPPFGPFAILNGLNEPPPNAAILPPIEAKSSITQLLTKPTKDYTSPDTTSPATNSATETFQVEKREGRLEEILGSPIEDNVGFELDRVAGASGEPPEDISEDRHNGKTQRDDHETPEKDPANFVGDDAPMSPKTRGRSRKNLRKWTEEETTALLRGVVKCGIGNWTAILAQPELKFNKRSAANLKDRFRVCCPWAYRAADPNEATKQLRDTLANALLRAETEGSAGTRGKILLPDPRPANTGSESTSTPGSSAGHDSLPPSSSSPPTHGELKTTRASSKYTPVARSAPTLSSKSMSTLESLGIPEPHFTMNSRRRSRRPFTNAEDEALLKGYAVHGFQWTLIQQDKRLSLSHRKATDLRDRFRTKFPHAYRDGGSQPRSSLYQTDCSLSNTLGPIDPALPPLAPPQGLLAVSSSSSNPTASSTGPVSSNFPLDVENTSGNLNVDGSWEDNTLPPMVWDELP
ncbi:hypothetical protein ASPZODRAFT_954579 [Penicilliopsis zonata CBS 506.65]|uniref:Myb-like domain-containing protein n=1 Tax=Penicilliopsis zonata CBS 506.65 TaxID=1073090 RepID=A0A1L9S8I4_9EURO|nr:hypothetical protein ASPZODRAFT_954579 [Penicilliopsis zonata CBS 506.65]OJJ43473.1 hypothetical protein ASPZODRAFT_954579 [Penicilliopsis zonata CBS 506.65]